MQLVRIIVIVLLLAAPAAAKDIPIADAAALNAAIKVAQPGDNLILRSGEWPDAQLAIKGHGTSSAPVTVKSAVPGTTVFTGNSALRLGGEWLVVEGLLFRDPDQKQSDLIQFRLNSRDSAKNCRLTNCAVLSSVNSDSSQESRWMNLYGADNRVDHCSFQGKTGKGATFVVWLGEGQEGRHQIDHNYFGPRELLGKNGGETIRVGDSNTAAQNALCVIEGNLFEKCNGETECISNKSCGNVYRKNTFLEVSGSLTLRHGNACLVEGNVFLGNNAQGTGGIRIIGEDHVIRDNYLERLTGDDARAAICFMMGIPDSPTNRYVRVKRARVENNSILDCKHSILIGLSDDKNATLAPIETVIRGNQVLSLKRMIIEARCPIDGISWEGNRFLGKDLGISTVKQDDILRPRIIPLQPINRSQVGTSW